MAEKTVSPSLSLKGWKFKTWLKKNKDSVKMLLAGAIGLATYSVGFIQNEPLNVFVSGAIAVGSRFGIDLLDYYTSDVVNKE